MDLKLHDDEVDFESSYRLAAESFQYEIEGFDNIKDIVYG
jgi:hypothetical protein